MLKKTTLLNYITAIGLIICGFSSIIYCYTDSQPEKLQDHRIRELEHQIEELKELSRVQGGINESIVATLDSLIIRTNK